MTSPAVARAVSARSVSSGASRLSALTRNVARLVEHAWCFYWDYQARRATMMLLHSLDDRTLSDIGFQRSEIHSVVFGSPDRVRPYHSDWMWGSAQPRRG